MEDDWTSRQDQNVDVEEEDQTPPGDERLKRKGQKRDGDRGRK